LEQPQSFIVPCKEDWVYLLFKCLYGLKQSSRTWNKKFDMFLQEFRLVASQADPCFYYLRRATDIIIVVLWVDDVLLTGSSMVLLTAIVDYLQRHFDITSRPADMFVGLPSRGTASNENFTSPSQSTSIGCSLDSSCWTVIFV
jgi:hypothetical protein